MRRIAVTNQKGGVGKTTTTANLGAALARLGQRVLVCDCDPQCNLSVHLGFDPTGDGASIYEVLTGRAQLSEVVRPTSQPGLEVVPSSVDLAGAELELAGEAGREVILARAFDGWDGATYDFVLLDCPPSLGLLSLNALVACNEVYVPIQAEFFALQGLGKLLDVVHLVRARLNPRLHIAAMFSCRHDPSTNLSKAVLADIRQHFGSVLLETVVRRNVKLAEAPSHGLTIFDHAPESRGAADYMTLAREVLARTRKPDQAASPVGVVSEPPEASELPEASGPPAASQPPDVSEPSEATASDSA